MIFLHLFYAFAKIGFVSFGGFSMLPQIMQEMLSNQWMTEQEFTSLVALAEITPGPLAINCATFAGMRVAGIPGALTASFAILLPTLTIGALASMYLERFKQNVHLKRILAGIRPACIGMLVSASITLGKDAYILPDAGSSLICIGIALVALVLLLWLKKSIPLTVVVCAALGAICFGLLPG